MFFVWALSPLVTRRKTFYFVVLLKRVLVPLVRAQCERQFSATARPAAHAATAATPVAAPSAQLLHSAFRPAAQVLCQVLRIVSFLSTQLLWQAPISLVLFLAARAPLLQVLCQVLRIVSFLSTQLPAPAPHCRAPESTSNAPWPVVRFVID